MPASLKLSLLATEIGSAIPQAWLELRLGKEVRIGSDSDLLGHARHVRFTPDSY